MASDSEPEHLFGSTSQTLEIEIPTPSDFFGQHTKRLKTTNKNLFHYDSSHSVWDLRLFF